MEDAVQIGRCDVPSRAVPADGVGAATSRSLSWLAFCAPSSAGAKTAKAGWRSAHRAPYGGGDAHLEHLADIA